jgi:hypothetical protein
MELEVDPEPTDEERRALLAFTGSVLGASGEPAAPRSAWRDAGIRENCGELPDGELPDDEGS